jgi:hypothetical protein
MIAASVVTSCVIIAEKPWHRVFAKPFDDLRQITLLRSRGSVTITAIRGVDTNVRLNADDGQKDLAMWPGKYTFSLRAYTFSDNVSLDLEMFPGHLYEVVDTIGNGLFAPTFVNLGLITDTFNNSDELMRNIRESHAVDDGRWGQGSETQYPIEVRNGITCLALSADVSRRVDSDCLCQFQCQDECPWEIG